MQKSAEEEELSNNPRQMVPPSLPSSYFPNVCPSSSCALCVRVTTATDSCVFTAFHGDDDGRWSFMDGRKEGGGERRKKKPKLLCVVSVVLLALEKEKKKSILGHSACKQRNFPHS